jgi:eukaryotic-like serine/threonine-protein kinase
MTQMPERFGRFVLLEQLETGWRGAEYRAAALAGTELERLVSLLRVNPALAEGDALVEHLRAAARMGGPRAIAIHEVGRVDGAAFVASDLVEGKSLRAVLARSRKEGWPIAPDNALQMASRVAAAVEHAHGHVSP